MPKSFEEEYVLINGISQYFLHYPSPQKDVNDVVIYLHGGPGSSVASVAYAQNLYFNFVNVVYYDQRGAGRTHKKSKSKPKDLTISNLITDLKQTINYIKEKYQTNRIILLGQSWGTVLGTQYILEYPDDVMCYIGTGHCVDSRRESRIIYDKLKGLVENKGKEKDIKKLHSLKDLPDMPVDEKGYVAKETSFFLLRSKYGLNMKMGKLLKLMWKSPIFKLSDIPLMVTAPKRNIQLIKWMTDWSIWDISDYGLPVYYILGQDDWQTPSILAAEYFEKINAPRKELYWVNNAGHATNLDNPVDFYKAVREIIKQL